MTINLYIDVLFLVNFSMDFLILTLMKQMFKKKTSWMKTAAGSLTGALWGVVSVMAPMPVWAGILTAHGVISSLMVYVTFRENTIRGHVTNLLELYVTGAAAGGILSILQEQIRAAGYRKMGAAAYGEGTLPVFILILTAAGSYFLIRGLWAGIWQKKAMEKHLYHVNLYYRGVKKEVKAFADTGNLLREPVTGQPVHVMSRDIGLELCKTVPSVIYVPYQTVGDKGIMPAVFLDSMEIEQNGKVMLVDRPLVAVSSRCLSSKNEYQMLLNEEIGL